MSKLEAIALARHAYAAHPALFHKLRPRLRNGVWVLECFITPICGLVVKAAADFETRVAELLDCGRQWADAA